MIKEYQIAETTTSNGLTVSSNHTVGVLSAYVVYEKKTYDDGEGNPVTSKLYYLDMGYCTFITQDGNSIPMNDKIPGNNKRVSITKTEARSNLGTLVNNKFKVGILETVYTPANISDVTV